MEWPREVGEPGPMGPQGWSAYQMALQNGYIGSATDWLASLIGAASTVPGPAGPAGQTGAAGANGSNGATGAASTVPGPAGSAGATGAAGPAGVNSWAAIPDKPLLQAIRALTSTSGTYTWTFPTAYPAGTIPVIALTAEGDALNSYQHVITAISNTAVTIRLVKVQDITILTTVHVLGIQTPGAATVHITAQPAT